MMRLQPNNMMVLVISLQTYKFETLTVEIGYGATVYLYIYELETSR